MRRGTTLIEIIFTIAIASILAVGTATILKNFALSIQRAKQLTELSLDTQSALDQISSLVYQRVPNSAIGYNGFNNHWNIRKIENSTSRVFEWYGTFEEVKMLGMFSGFIDLEDSNFTSKTLKSPLSNFTQINTAMTQKFPGKTLSNTAIVFAGSLDMGAGTFDVSSTNKTNFGWHGDTRKDVFAIATTANSDTIKITSTNQPTYIYEKFYLADTAYAITRSIQVDMSAACIKNSIDINNIGLTDSEKKNLLLLFYDYRPWAGETFCADFGSAGTKSGKVALVSSHIVGFRVEYLNFAIRITLDAKQKLRGDDGDIHVSKQKVIF